MKYSTTYLHTVFLVGAIMLSCSPTTHVQTDHGVKIVGLDSISLQSYYAYRALNNIDTILVISQKSDHPSKCKSPIEVGKSYDLKLDEVFSIPVSDDLTMRVDGKGFYIDDRVILGRRERAFTSSNLAGTCYVSSR